MLCPSCSAAALDAYGRCPHCGYSAAPPAQPYAAYYPQASLIAPTAPAGVGLAAQILIAVAGLVSIVAFGVNIWNFTVAKHAFDIGVGPDDQTSVALSGLFFILGGLVALATGIVFIIWFAKSANLAEILAPGRQLLPPGWAIGGWFIPLAWYVMPRLVAGGIWRAAIPLTGDPYARKPRTYLVTWWWITFIIGQTSFLWAVNGVPGESAPSVGALVFDYGLSGVGDLSRVASAVLGIIMIRKLTSMQQIRILQGPGVGHPYAAPVAATAPYAAYVDPMAPGYPGAAPAAPGYAPTAVQPQPVAPPQQMTQPIAQPTPVEAPTPYQASVPPQAPAPQDEALPRTVVEPAQEAPEAPEPADAVPADIPTAVIPRQAEDHATMILAPVPAPRADTDKADEAASSAVEAADEQPTDQPDADQATRKLALPQDSAPQDAVPTEPTDA